MGFLHFLEVSQCSVDGKHTTQTTITFSESEVKYPFIDVNLEYMYRHKHTLQIEDNSVRSLTA